MACMYDSLTDLVGWMEFMGDAFVWHGGGGLEGGGKGIEKRNEMETSFTHTYKGLTYILFKKKAYERFQ